MENSSEAKSTDFRLRRQIRRKAFIMFWTILVCLILMTAFLFSCQRRLIYFPRPYEPSYRFGFPEGAIALEHEIRGWKQESYYIPPATGESPPPTLWVMFGGNGSRALDWLDMVERTLPEDAGALLIDYPGYGVSEGKPTRATIGDASKSAFQALAKELDVEPEALETDLRALAHSLGAAVALEFAIEHPMRQMILIAPFTSLTDMARRTVGRPLHNLAVDRFDNRARLAELAEMETRPDIVIFHGTKDRIVPVEMGKELADLHPDWIEFHSVENADHNWILESVTPRVRELME